MAITNHYPEMQKSEPTATIIATYSIGKYRVTSKELITVKRGVTANGIVDAYGANNMPNAKKGWYRYYVTFAALQMIAKTNDVVILQYLD